MPPSQLKRLKTSLREQGITGPQKSKKQKKALKGSKTTSDRVQKSAALQQIRDSFNPFELKAPSRPAKFQHANTTNGTNGKVRYKDVLHRPGVTRSAGEEMRRATLLPELQRRHKVGGLVDRRIGEGDTGLTAEERAIERFAQEKQRRKGGSLFDLEASDDDEPKVSLTHGGRSLGELAEDDFTALSGGESAGSEVDNGELLTRKRRREDDGEDDIDGQPSSGEDAEEPERKKSRREVMQEVVAKSKLHKYERQKVKEDDDELREELDKGMGDLLGLLRGRKPVPPPQAGSTDPAARSPGASMNADRLKLLNGADRDTVNKEYESRLKQLAREQKAKPSDRTKTEEEKIKEEAQRLKDLEEKRARRMRGERLPDEEPNVEKDDQTVEYGDDDIQDEAAEFGFTISNAPQTVKEKIVLDDEDDFAIDEELVASGSDLDLSDMSDAESDAGSSSGEAAENDEDEFVKDILGDGSPQDPKVEATAAAEPEKGIAFTYPCPRTHTSLLKVIANSPVEQLPTIVQRIRALHHPSLNATHKEAMADFSVTLVEHLFYMGIQRQPLSVSEQVIRHLHSLSRTYPQEIATAFRTQLQLAHARKDPDAGDLLILTAIGSIYPTSDHFHQVVTPATTVMAKWLAMNVPDSTQKHATGGFLVALGLHYQRLSKRYIPEAVRFILRAISSRPKPSEEQMAVHLNNVSTMADLWKSKSAFIEIFEPFIKPLANIPAASKVLRTINIMLQQARTARRPLELHHHRPLAIRMSIPKFEDTFNPEKHYDPDKDRSDAKKLQREYKREKKGAIRELRKDANFLAREGLREKKEKDAEYEKKQRRLIAEIQGEEGREAKEYEREKGRRKRRVGK